MNMEKIENTLDSLYSREFPGLVSLDADAYFIDCGAVDSFDFIRLLAALETEFSIKLADDEISESNLGSKNRIRAFIGSRLAADR